MVCHAGYDTMDAVEPDTCTISNYWRAPGGLRFGQTAGTAAGGPAPGWGRWWGLSRPAGISAFAGIDDVEKW